MTRDWVLLGQGHASLDVVRDCLGRWASSVEGSSRSWRAFASSIFRHSVLVTAHVADDDKDALVALDATLRGLKGFSVDPFVAARPQVA